MKSLKTKSINENCQKKFNKSEWWKKLMHEEGKQFNEWQMRKKLMNKKWEKITKILILIKMYSKNVKYQKISRKKIRIQKKNSEL